jgi:hypothetical protein
MKSPLKPLTGYAVVKKLRPKLNFLDLYENREVRVDKKTERVEEIVVITKEEYKAIKK